MQLLPDLAFKAGIEVTHLAAVYLGALLVLLPLLLLGWVHVRPQLLSRLSRSTIIIRSIQELVSEVEY
jgi:hypothetical protein